MTPIPFVPLYMKRVWGGRTLETEYGRVLPEDAPHGESWEIVDRSGEQSIVEDGPLAGTSLHELWTHHHGGQRKTDGPVRGHAGVLTREVAGLRRPGVLSIAARHPGSPPFGAL
ncbi:hypothetical protein HNR46_003712 [Haloferula luteola]|uniref:Mannose-6-phosphate isomerase n=1 Tax=Haloferula luteola TaxID=595692 RepID=A0A840VLD7_9BACT|nr:hypothetical protein [Haloferula luteola]